MLHERKARNWWFRCSRKQLVKGGSTRESDNDETQNTIGNQHPRSSAANGDTFHAETMNNVLFRLVETKRTSISTTTLIPISMGIAVPPNSLVIVVEVLKIPVAQFVIWQQRPWINPRFDLCQCKIFFCTLLRLASTTFLFTSQLMPCCTMA